MGKSIQLEVFDYSGRKLDLSVCKEDIKVLKYIGDVTEELDIQSAMDLADKGIDVFNPEDDFFNDICHSYNNTDGKDIVLNDRRTEIYKNATFCEEGCTYTGMNYDLMVANCICDSSYLQKEEDNTKNNEENKFTQNTTFNSVTKSFISNLFDFNFDVIYCINLGFDIKILVNNIGFYSLAIMFILQIILFFVYLIKRLKPLKHFMLFFENKIIKNNNIVNGEKKINLISKVTYPPKNKINSKFKNHQK